VDSVLGLAAKVPGSISSLDLNVKQKRPSHKVTFSCGYKQFLQAPDTGQDSKERSLRPPMKATKLFSSLPPDVWEWRKARVFGGNRKWRARCETAPVAPALPLPASSDCCAVTTNTWYRFWFWFADILLHPRKWLPLDKNGEKKGKRTAWQPVWG